MLKVTPWLAFACLLYCLTLPPLAADTNPYREAHHITGGATLADHEAPWLVWVHRAVDERTSTYLCNGSLIAPNWVLTAAHCVDDKPRDQLVLSFGPTIFGERRKGADIGRIVLHPDFNSQLVDAALIELLTPSTQQPITPLPVVPEVGADITAIGSASAMRDRFKGRMATLAALHQGLCSEQTSLGPHISCAGRLGIAVEKGDSGGPIVTPHNGGWGQLGVISGRFSGTGAFGLLGTITLYTRIEAIHDWILQTAGPLQPQPSLSTVLPHVFVGPLGNTDAQTEIIITNRHPSTDCEADLTVSHGTDLNPRTETLRFPAGSAQRFTVTSNLPDRLITAAVYVTPASGCPDNALVVEGRYLLHRMADGAIIEAFSVDPQKPQDWLANGQCRTLSGLFGQGRDIGLAWTTATLGQDAPEGTRLSVRVFDWDGNPAETLPVLPITGWQTALNPWTLEAPRMIELCLEVPDSSSNFRLALIAIAATVAGNRVQYSAQALIRP